MSNLIVRLLLSILMIPLAIILYVVVVVSTDRHFGSGSAIVAASATWIFIAIYWISLWREAVQWDSWRTSATLVAAVLSALTALIAGVVLNNVERDLGTVIGSLTAPLLWLVSTLLIWRETSTERVERLRCRLEGAGMPGMRVQPYRIAGSALSGMRDADDS